MSDQITLLISDEYRAQCAELHASDPTWGGGLNDDWLRAVVKAQACSGITSMLDYGAGKQALQGAFPAFRIKSYDPAVPEIAALPEAADVVICNKVLEHVEPDRLEVVLDHICALARHRVVIKITTVPSGLNLPDGRNAHLIVEEGNWWLERLLPRWTLLYAEQMAKGLRFVGETKVRGDSHGELPISAQ